MNLTEIQKLIEERNEHEQRVMYQNAHQLIERIASLQSAKAEADKEIAECREELKKLSMTPITPAELLGE